MRRIPTPGPRQPIYFARDRNSIAGVHKALEDAVIRGVDEAAAAVEPVTIERGSGRCVIGIHRRRLVNGSIQMAPNPKDRTIRNAQSFGFGA